MEFNGRKVKAYWDQELETVIVTEMDGTIIPSSTDFAFVYPAYFQNSLRAKPTINNNSPALAG